MTSWRWTSQLRLVLNFVMLCWFSSTLRRVLAFAFRAYIKLLTVLNTAKMPCRT